ncbi:MAG: diacylglycerol kinase family protein [Bacteroidota bacterium]
MLESTALSESLKKQSIRFIVNPYSGVSRKKNIALPIRKYLDHQRFDYEICKTEGPGHATVLAREAADAGKDIVVAVGGDGSVNEVAKGLMGTDVSLGILPGGSGNGFAMHLGWGRNIKKAIQLLNHTTKIRIDTCRMNEDFYVNLAGIGFDAWVARQLKQSGVRGFFSYLRWALKGALGYRARKYQLEIDGQQIERECLLVEVANAPMFGYHFEIAPKAKYDDGLLEIILIKKAPKLRYLLSLWRFFNGSAHHSSLVERYTAKTLRVCSEQTMDIHTDGEGFQKASCLNFSVNPLSLNILIPEKGMVKST